MHKKYLLNSSFFEAIIKLKTAKLPSEYGGIAQLVERQLCKLDVRGSNPRASMFTLASLTIFSLFITAILVTFLAISTQLQL